MFTRSTFTVLAALPLMAACASSPPPADRMASAESALRAAKEVGAERVPQAQLMVKLAQDQITQAKKLSEEGKNDEAASLLSRATADAELGLAMAREEAAKTAVHKSPSGAETTTAPAAL